MMDAMSTAEVIARIVGPVYILISLGMITDPNRFRDMVKPFAEQPALTYLGAIMALAFGVSVLTFHFVWVADWTVTVTLLGCLATAKGVLLILAPDRLFRMWQPMLDTPGAIRVGGIFALALGVFFSGMGYGWL